MSEKEKPELGAISWFDLTVEKAEEVKEFYGQVVGWKAEPVDMKGYQDFSMNTPDGQCVAGICHARGENAEMPAQWLLYITVADLDQSSARCVELGGKVLAQPRDLGGAGRMCVIRDPAGAVAALFEPADKS